MSIGGSIWTRVVAVAGARGERGVGHVRRVPAGGGEVGEVEPVVGVAIGGAQVLERPGGRDVQQYAKHDRDGDGDDLSALAAQVADASCVLWLASCHHVTFAAASGLAFLLERCDLAVDDGDDAVRDLRD